MPRVFDPRNDKLFDTVSGYFSAESLENRVIARPVRKLVVAIRSPQCGALHWPQANHKLTDKLEFEYICNYVAHIMKNKKIYTFIIARNFFFSIDCA